jgi:hypothetical protein
MSRLLLENSNRAKEKAPEMQSTPYSTSQLLADSSQVQWSTPRKSRELRDQIQIFTKLDTDPSTNKLLFRKIAKAFDEKDSLLATAERQVDHLERQLEAARPKKRRKVRTSPNSKFVNIGAIWQAQNEANGVEIEEDDGEGSIISESQKPCIEVHF